MVNVEGNEIGDPSSNLGWTCLHFTSGEYNLERYETCFPTPMAMGKQ